MAKNSERIDALEAIIKKQEETNNAILVALKDLQSKNEVETQDEEETQEEVQEEQEDPRDKELAELKKVVAGMQQREKAQAAEAVKAAVDTAFRNAAKEAGITEDAKLNDVVKLYADPFKLVNNELVLHSNGKPVMEKENPLSPITVESFFETLKEQRPDYFPQRNADTGSVTDFFNFDVVEHNAGDRVKVDVTDPTRRFTEEEQKAISEGRAEYHVN